MHQIRNAFVVLLHHLINSDKYNKLYVEVKGNSELYDVS